jgi:hypothetical protein
MPRAVVKCNERPRGHERDTSSPTPEEENMRCGHGPWMVHGTLWFKLRVEAKYGRY